MFREHLLKQKSNKFQLRGKEPGRLENFSDAVFALAITLLLISTSPPTNFEQIRRFVFDLIPFAMCITLIILIWYEHYQFFARYGLRSGRVVALNTLFLVIVLFYVYPLKFLTKLSLFLVALVFDIDWLWDNLRSMIKGEDMPDLMIIYGIGASGIFWVLRLMYAHAYRLADQLNLTELERFDTRVSMRTNTLMAVVPMISIFFALMISPHWSAGMISGMTYFLYSPLMFWHARKVEKERLKLLEKDQVVVSQSEQDQAIRED